VSITACQNYLQTLLQGMTTPLSPTPMEAWLEPPVPTTAEVPQAYILAAEGNLKRQTMGGLMGYYEDTHQIYVYLEWMLPPGTTNGNQAFTNLIDTVIATVRASYTGAIFITDPVTGLQSQLLVIGDRLAYKYLPPPNLGEGQQEYLDYVAQITFEVKEKTQQFVTP
jgi:hypothetical protein